MIPICASALTIQASSSAHIRQSRRGFCMQGHQGVIRVVAVVVVARAEEEGRLLRLGRLSMLS